MILCHIIAIHWRPTSSIALLRAESALLHASAFSEQFPCTWSTGIAVSLYFPAIYSFTYIKPHPLFFGGGGA